jgi:hypothetical protein
MDMFEANQGNRPVLTYAQSLLTEQDRSPTGILAFVKGLQNKKSDSAPEESDVDGQPRLLVGVAYKVNLIGTLYAVAMRCIAAGAISK